MAAGIYQIRNIVNGHCYIGQAADIDSRWRQHKSGLRNGRGVNPHLQAAWDKYGPDLFEFEVLAALSSPVTKQELADLEQDYADFFLPVYNMRRECVVSQLGVKWSLSDATRLRQSKAQKGRKVSAEARANISAAQMGRRHTLETCAKMSASRMGHHFNSGWKHTAEWKDAQSKRLSGHPVSEETRRKIHDAIMAKREVFVLAGRKGRGIPKKKNAPKSAAQTLAWPPRRAGRNDNEAQ